MVTVIPFKCSCCILADCLQQQMYHLQLAFCTAIEIERNEYD